MRLEFIDGLRGLTALYVVLFHSVTEQTAGLSRPVVLVTNWMRHGPLAVSVFIVLSGYCLMLPVARSSGGHLPGGAWSFFKRRAWRIMPPYYAALALSLLLILASSKGLHFLKGSHDPELLATFAPGDLLSHLLLFHNASRSWLKQIDYPMWSIAVEWQIYFLFPFVLLPLFRRWGIGTAIFVGLLLGLAPHYLLPVNNNMDWTRPWYIGLFALGMGGAAVNGDLSAGLSRLRDGIPWGVITSGLFLAVCAAVSFPPKVSWYSDWMLDAIVGAATVCLIVHCGRQATASRERKATWAKRILESRWVVGLGAFSYSLYLMHIPSLFKFQPIVRALHLSPDAELLFRLFVGVPWAIGFSYLFYLAVEKRALAFRSAPRRASTPLVPTTRWSMEGQE